MPCSQPTVSEKAGRQQIGQNDRWLLVGEPYDVERDGAALVFRKFGGEPRILIGPVAAEGDYFLVGAVGGARLQLS